MKKLFLVFLLCSVTLFSQGKFYKNTVIVRKNGTRFGHLIQIDVYPDAVIVLKGGKTIFSYSINNYQVNNDLFYAYEIALDANITKGITVDNKLKLEYSEGVLTITDRDVPVFRYKSIQMKNMIIIYADKREI